MKKLLMLVCSLQLLLIVTGCSKEKQTLLKNTWEVESMTVYMDSMFIHFPAEFFSTDDYTYYTYTFTLEFLNKEAFRVRFCSGSVYGKVKIEKNKISFFDLDSKGYNDYSESCIRALSDVNYYEIQGEKLVLKGDKGEFNFKQREL